jgi:hypothetical protein
MDLIFFMCYLYLIIIHFILVLFIWALIIIDKEVKVLIFGLHHIYRPNPLKIGDIVFFFTTSPSKLAPNATYRSRTRRSRKSE